jgi:hypothetical protein
MEHDSTHNRHPGWSYPFSSTEAPSYVGVGLADNYSILPTRQPSEVYRGLNNNDLEQPQRRDQLAPDWLVSASKPSPGFVGPQISFSHANAGTQITTGGALIGWNGKIYQLTVGHCMMRNHDSSVSTKPGASQVDLDDIEFEDDEDNDTYFEDDATHSTTVEEGHSVHDITSRGSQTPTEKAFSDGTESDDSTVTFPLSSDDVSDRD